MPRDTAGDEEAYANIEAKLEELRRRAEGKREVVVTIHKQVQGGSTLKDEDVYVATITLRIPASALLGNVSISRGARAQAAPDIILIDSDPTDIGSADGDPGPIVDADGNDLIH